NRSACMPLCTRQWWSTMRRTWSRPAPISPEAAQPTTSDLELRDRDADVALECAGLVVHRHIRGVVLEQGAGIELQATARQPVAEQRHPGLTEFGARPIESGRRIRSARNRGLLVLAGADKIRFDFDGGVVAQSLRRRDPGVVEADAVTWPAQSAIGLHPGKDRALPNLRQLRAVWADI